MRVCIESNCNSESRKIKTLSDIDFHDKHSTIGAHTLQKDVCQMFSDEYLKDFGYYYSIEGLRLKVLKVVKEIKGMADQFQSDMIKSIEQMDQILNYHIQSILEVKHQNDIMNVNDEMLEEVIKMVQQGPEQITASLKLLKKELLDYLANIREKSQTNFQTIHSHMKVHQQYQNVAQQQQQKVKVQMSRNISEADYVSGQSALQWSKTMRNENIEVINSKSSQSVQDWGLILVEPVLNKRVAQNLRLKVHHLEEQNSGLSIGMTHQHLAQAKDYYFGYDDSKKVGHGFYMMNYKGRTYSHRDKEWNDKQKGFEFQEGDIIELHYNPISQSLIVSKLNGELGEQIEMEVSVEDGFLHFCAELRACQIEILGDDLVVSC